jgi:hypothetical protein
MQVAAGTFRKSALAPGWDLPDQMPIAAWKFFKANAKKQGPLHHSYGDVILSRIDSMSLVRQMQPGLGFPRPGVLTRLAAPDYYCRLPGTTFSNPRPSN